MPSPVGLSPAVAEPPASPSDTNAQPSQPPSKGSALPKDGAKDTWQGFAPVNPSPQPHFKGTLQGFAPVQADPRALSKGTLRGMAAVEPPPRSEASAEGSASAEETPSFQRTLPGAVPPAIPPGTAPGAEPDSRETAGASPAKRTLLGIARPGIAPTAPGPAPPGGEPPPNLKTLQGVARPGIAPTGESKPPSTPIRSDSDPSGSTVPRGLATHPRASKWVGWGLMALVLGLAGTAAVLWKDSAVPLTVEGFDVAPDGTDRVRVRCTDCPDGTRVVLGDETASFAAGRATVATTTPLAVGDNQLALEVSRPGRAPRTVTAVVPVSYRARIDLEGLGASPPYAEVRVNARPGTDLLLDGTPLEIDDQGHGVHRVDLSREASGEQSSRRVVEREFAIERKGSDSPPSVVRLRVAVTPLELVTPGLRFVARDDEFRVSGRSDPSAQVQIGDREVSVDARGSFSAKVAPPTGPLTVRARAPNDASRTVMIEVAQKKTDAPLTTADETSAGYPDLQGSPGKQVTFSGRVVEARRATEGTILLLDVDRGCQAAPCLAKILYADERSLARGTRATVAGEVVASVGSTIPHVRAADLVVGGRR